MVILLQQKLCDRGNRRHSRRKSVTGAARFQHRHVLFKRRACWILRSSVFEAFMFAEALLDVGGGLVDGDRYCAGCGIRLLAGVDGVCFKAHKEKLYSPVPKTLRRDFVIVAVDEDFPRFCSIRRANDAVALHGIEEAGCTAVSDA